MNETTEQLSHRVAITSSRFFLARVVLGVAIVLTLGILLVLNIQSQQQNHELLNKQSQQITQQKQIINQLVDNNRQQIKQANDLQRHIDCIVSLFTLPNRANLVITDITNCQLTSVSSPGGAASAPPKVASAPPTFAGEPAPTSPFRTIPETRAKPSSPAPPTAAKAAPRPNILQRLLKSLGL